MKRVARLPSALAIIVAMLSLGMVFVFSGGVFAEVKDRILGRVTIDPVSETVKTIPESLPSLPEPLGDPNIVSLLPEDGATDVLLGVEDPLLVRFDRSMKPYYVDFRLSPAVSMVYQNDPEKTEFQLLPQETLAPDVTYSLSVHVKRRGEGDQAYRLIRTSQFTVLAEKPEAWSKDVAARLEEARRYARPTIFVGKYIDINLENQSMALFENGKLSDIYPISSGKRGMDTPKGRYEIENKARRPFSKRYGLYMPYWMALTPSGLFGIHELPEWPGGYKEGADHLGRPVSHGCVRLGVGPAARVWNWAEEGTPVVVH